MDNSHNPTETTPRPAQASQPQPSTLPPQKPRSKKKFWLLVTLIPAGAILLLFLASLLIITTWQSSTVDTTGSTIKPTVTRGFLNNNYANGAEEVTIESTDGKARVFLGASSDISHLAVFKQSGVYGYEPSELEIRNATDGKIEKTLSGTEECSIVTGDDSLFCSVQSDNGQSRSIAEISLSTGRLVGKSVAMSDVTSGTTAPDAPSIASFYTSSIDHISNLGDKRVVLIEQWKGLLNPSHRFVAIINPDGSLDSSIYLEGVALGDYCLPVRQGKGLACSRMTNESPSVTVVDLESKSVNLFENVGPEGSTVTITDDGWIVDASFVGSTGISIGGADKTETKVEIFDLDGNSITKTHRVFSVTPSSQFLANDLTMYNSAKSFIDKEEAYTSRLIVDGNGNVAAQDVYGNAGKDMYKVSASGKQFDGYTQHVTLDGKTFVISPDDLQSSDLTIRSADGKDIQKITLAGDTATSRIANGILYSDERYGADQKIVVFVPKS